MSDQQEEQEMEAEALTAIFEDHFEPVHTSYQPFVWKVTLWPEATSDSQNHVGIALQVTLPPTYPDEGLPDCDVTVLKGLTQDHAGTLLELAQDEARANEGVPSVFAICERLREWLVEHNEKGHDDVSMHAQMLRRDAEAKKKQEQKQKSSTQYESQKTNQEMTLAEREELEVRQMRADGTPVNDQTFAEWKRKFEAEMARLKERQKAEAQDAKSKKAKAKSAAEKQQIDSDKAGRLTGFQQFSDKTFNLEALEAAAEDALADSDEEEEEEGVKEELFDVEDEDLDDLDFDDDDDEDEDDKEDDVDI